MLTPVTLSGMDDKPAIEYHPFGTITLNFDDGPVKLRRCRYGDLRFAKDLLEEIRAEGSERRDKLVAGISEVGEALPALSLPEAERTAIFNALTVEEREEMGVKVKQVTELSELLIVERINIVHAWLSKVAERMGDAQVPAKDDWPLELLEADIPNAVISHWQTRPLASGKSLGQNRTITDQNSSGPHLAVVSSPPEPQPQ